MAEAELTGQIDLLKGNTLFSYQLNVWLGNLGAII